MWWIWIILYLVIGVGVSVYGARQWVAEEAKNISKHATKRDGSKRTEEERLLHIAYDMLWPAFFNMMIWPLAIVVDGFAHIITRPALKAAKQREIDAKTQKILAELEKEDKEKFKDL